MRVGFLCNNFQPVHGWATVAVKLGQGLQDLGVEVVALTTPADGEPVDITPVDRRPVLPELGQAPQALRLWAANGRVARATRDCDLLNVVAEPFALACRSAARRRPVVVTACGTYVPRTCIAGRLRALYAAAYRDCDIVAISRYTASRVREVLPGVEPTVIVPGVDYASFQQPGTPPTLGDAPLVLSAGGLKPRKGTEVLVEAMAQVRQRLPEARLAIVGSAVSPAYRETIEQQIAALGLSDAVHLPGRVSFEELLGWYQAATVFTLPSVNAGPRFEGFGLVLLEAQACGVPAIGSLDCGNEDALLDGKTGLLVPQGDADELASRLLELLTDEPRRTAMGEAARAYAAEQDWRAVAERTLAHYEALLARRARR